MSQGSGGLSQCGKSYLQCLYTDPLCCPVLLLPQTCVYGKCFVLVQQNSLRYVSFFLGRFHYLMTRDMYQIKRVHFHAVLLNRTKLDIRSADLVDPYHQQETYRFLVLTRGSDRDPCCCPLLLLPQTSVIAKPYAPNAFRYVNFVTSVYQVLF